MNKPVIKVENLSKQYRLGEVGTGTISHDLNRWWHRIRGKEDPYLRIGESNDRTSKGNSEYVWALQDINFEVQQGEVLGIIGKNGAGKSTLLKILSKVTAPTTGSIKAKGRIAALLEVGTGFHPELTGRENIYLNGTILGMTKREVTAKLDEIVDFSGVERYLDTPVKRYSSGMMVRLGFAVAAHLEPEILIVDEVLAVGDAEFQKKAVGKMESVAKTSNRTVLFVSHNMAAVRSLCSRSVVMNQGKVEFIGETPEAVEHYLEITRVGTTAAELILENNPAQTFSFSRISLKDAEGHVKNTFESNEEIFLDIKLRTQESIRGSRIVFQLIGQDEIVVFASTNHNLTSGLSLHGTYQVQCKIPGNLLNTGAYQVRLHAGIPNQQVLVQPQDYLSLQILNSGVHGSIFQEKWPGIIAPALEWKIQAETQYHD
ncbi:ABC transporter ATP-binding protein [Haliscomenobacter hydrossis]|uniref:Teichoic-acid-transporting ATPase n=1 Tax=Haliscomenobacter hydrossis (strain ATCC 27775 / DSM 1100 / LMG 10767 / O) TaxID=760192 RepID=F4L438_HALH1|nr:ABC transporter ATP-binding protein [Haliscomenobacter hydrossis]AEE50736.1 Teichoic-acid-transporting ATPase [Haliscomenobacter hydrossis DSM 1100]